MAVMLNSFSIQSGGGRAAETWPLKQVQRLFGVDDLAAVGPG